MLLSNFHNGVIPRSFTIKLVPIHLKQKMAAHQLYFCFSRYTHTEIYLQASSQLKEAFGWVIESGMWPEVMAEIFKLNTHFLKPPCSILSFFLLLENLRCLLLKRVASEDGRGLIHKTGIRAWKRTTWHTGYDVNGKDTFTVLSHWDLRVVCYSGKPNDK